MRTSTKSSCKTATVADMSTRELKAVLKERDEALKAAEQALEKLSRDMALANRRIEELNAEAAERSAREKEAQVDETAVEAAWKEAEERTRAQVEKEFKIARVAAQEQVMAANEAAAQTRGELARVKRELDNLRFEAARLEEKAALASDEDLVLFQVLLDQANEPINKMLGVIMKKRGKEPDAAERLTRSMFAMFDRAKEAARG